MTRNNMTNGAVRKEKLKILQTNIGRSRMAHDIAFATENKFDIDVIIVGEPNKKVGLKRR